ncbi:MAG: transglutaminase-like domain-containing protein, partial [Candidatus Margulisbacteria bacterium]|nr:transglutaminase-like domain-containing protein [Candidatus Margulisiibacteriota bacterium]
MKNTATSREKAEKITEHYSQVQLQEPLQIPDNMRTQLESWQKLSPQRIAENLRDYLQENYVYSTAPSVVETYRNSSSSRENTFLREGVGDCNEFNQVFVTILRSYFHLPARLVEGSLYDLNLRNAHTWSEVFYEGSWHRFDATGSAPELGLFYNSEDAFDSPYYPYLQLAKLSPTPSNYFYLQAELAQIATELREAITSRDKGLELDTNLKRDAYSKRFFEIARSLGKGREAATSAVKNLEKILNSSEGLSSGYRDLYQQYSLGLFPEETPEKTIAEKILSFVLSKNTSNKRRAVLLTTINSYAKDHLGEGYLRNLYKNRMLALDDYARIALINLTAESSKSPEITREIATLSGYLKHHRFFFDKRLVSDFGQRNNKFLFDSLRRHGQTNRFFVALANYLNSKISNASARDDVAPLDRGYFEAEKNLSDQERNILNDLSTLSYLAYRTQGRDKRRACQRLFNKLSKINQKRWLFAMDRPWHFYIHYDSDMLQRHSLHMYAIGWEQHDSFLKMFSLHFMLRMEERQSAEIFRPHINEVYQTVRTEVDERTTSGRELDRLEFFALLWLARIDENSPRFLDLARQVAPRVLEQVQQQEIINFSNLDLSTLQDLLYLDEDGTGMRIVSAMISKTRFSSFEEFWNFKTAYNSRTTSRTVARPESSVEMKKAFLELFVTLWQPEFDYLLEEWGSPQEIAEFVQPHLEQIPIDGYL